MIVSSILRRKGSQLFHITPDSSLLDCISMLNKHRIGCLLVIDRNDVLQGIISERDILHAVGAQKFRPAHTLVQDFMTPKERLITASQEDALEEIMERMTDNRVRHLPIMEGERIVGMISIGDVVKELLDFTQEERHHLINYITGRSVANI